MTIRYTGARIKRVEDPRLLRGQGHFAGEAVAAVVAECPYVAADGRERVAVEYDPLPAVTTVEGGTVVFRRVGSQGDVESAFGRAALVVEETFTHGRCAASPMEPRGIVAD